MGSCHHKKDNCCGEQKKGTCPARACPHLAGHFAACSTAATSCNCCCQITMPACHRRQMMPCNCTVVVMCPMNGGCGGCHKGGDCGCLQGKRCVCGPQCCCLVNEGESAEAKEVGGKCHCNGCDCGDCGCAKGEQCKCGPSCQCGKKK